MVDGATLPVIACVGFIVVLTMGACARADASARHNAKIQVCETWVLGSIVWPLVWLHVVGEQATVPYAIVGLAWPLILTAIDVVTLRKRFEVLRTRPSYSMDGNGLCSLIFAISGLMGGHKCCSHIFVAAVVACVAFVIPSGHGNDDPNSLSSIRMESLQKICLNCATGLLLTGVFVVLHKTPRLTGTD